MRLFLAALAMLLPLRAGAMSCDRALDCNKGMKCVDHHCTPDTPDSAKPETPPAQVAPAEPPKKPAHPKTSRTCAFLDGPRAGEVLYLSPEIYPQIPTFRIGDPCTDGFNSRGVAVADSTRKKKDKTPPDEVGRSRVCRFTSGPLIGQIRSFPADQFPDFNPVPIGDTCTDGAGSVGVAVASSERVVAPAATPAGTARTCQFTTGPRAGQTQYFAPAFYPDFVPQAIGSACRDTMGSIGFIVADSAIPTNDPGSAGLSRTCRFTNGPRIGQTMYFSPQEYPNMQSAPVGTPCGDGRSGGVFIAESRNKEALPATGGRSRTCRFTTGPRAGDTMYFAEKVYPDMPPFQIGIECSDGRGSYGFAVADQ